MNYQGNLQHGKATLYVRSQGMISNIVKVEVRQVEVLRRQWAQYPGGVDCRFLQPRQRNWRRYTEGYRPYLVVLDGWGHPDPQSPWETVKDTSEVSVSEARHSAFSSGWDHDFDGWLAAYLEATPSAKVLGDYRHTAGCSGYDQKVKAEFDDHEVESVRSQLVDAGVPHAVAAEVAPLYVHKSPNWAAGVLSNEHDIICTVSRGRRHAEAIHLNGEIIEPGQFFDKAS